MKSVLVVALLGLTLLNINASAQQIQPTSNSKQMKQYSLLVRVPENYQSEQAVAAGPLWEKLLEKWKADHAYVLSFAFPGESYTVSGQEKEVKKEIVLSGKLRVVSNIVLQAETIEQALEQAKFCPILLSGGTVEVREIPKPVQRFN